MNSSIKNKISFLKGVKRQYPALYRAAMGKRGGGGLSGLGETVEEIMARQDAFGEPTQSPGALDNALNTGIDFIKQLLPVYVGAQQAKTCIQINAERAKIGQAPIDCASSGLAPQVSVGVSPDVKYVMWGALAIGVIFLLMKKR